MDQPVHLPTTITPVAVLCRTQGIGRIQAEAIVVRMTPQQRQELMVAYQQGNLPRINEIANSKPPTPSPLTPDPSPQTSLGRGEHVAGSD